MALKVVISSLKLGQGGCDPKNIIFFVLRLLIDGTIFQERKTLSLDHGSMLRSPDYVSDSEMMRDRVHGNFFYEEEKA